MRFKMLGCKLLLLIAVSFCLAGSNVYADGPFTIGLTGTGSGPVPNPYVTLMSQFTGPATALQVVAQIDFNPASGTTHTKAKIEVNYNSTFSGWTLNIADSPTCNGYGGDSGTTKNNAELQIVNKSMDVYSVDLSQGVVDHLLNLTPISWQGTTTFVVKNQSVSWSPCPTSGILDTSNSHLLYAIPDTDPAGDGSKIYLGINRVVSGPGDRIGKGVSRVSITMQ